MSRGRGAAVLLMFVPLLGLGLAGCRPSHPTLAEATPPAERPELGEQVRQFCGACHAYPAPDLFPRQRWDAEVRRGFRFFKESHRDLTPPPIEEVVHYYQDRAPLELPPADIRYASTPVPVRLQPLTWPGPSKELVHAVSNVSLVHLTDDKQPEILACDMGAGSILLLRPRDPEPTWKTIGKVKNPAHLEVVDLDGDGIKDVLVADLGVFDPQDVRLGRVIWLRGGRDGSFTAHTLLDKVGRVADVRAADFRGTGKLDLIVAEFGFQRNGCIHFLENRTEDWSKPKFVSQVIDGRHGPIHVPVLDLNGDGKADFIALISQEFETVVAFLNEGGGRFRKEALYTAPHPAYGSSGIQLVDLNGDGHPDVLYTNGDTLDLPPLLRPYHGIQWLENPGDGRFPWKHHPIAPMYGAHSAVAADFDGDGDMDVAAVAFLPERYYPERATKKYDALILLEQTKPGIFVRHVLESGNCNHATCAAGDVLGHGRPDLLAGNFGFGDKGPVTLWRQVGNK